MKVGTYKYLTEMRLNTLTKERAAKLIQERDESAAKLRELEATTLESMWLRELEALEGRYAEDRQWRIQLQNPEGGAVAGSGGGMGESCRRKRNRAVVENKFRGGDLVIGRG